ncbi:MAG: hypothetical protein SGJ27_03795 [Candidatus Melainabacteria bacterium]|nr:hypothetical protein [Candidatus Melainabacteria bacterium]
MVEKDDLSEKQPATKIDDVDATSQSENEGVLPLVDEQVGLPDEKNSPSEKPFSNGGELASAADAGNDSSLVVETAHTASAQRSSQSPLKHDRDLFWACIAVVAIMTGRLIHTVMLHPLRIGWDPALHLQAAQLITQGKVPYVDMFDVNPPLIWYLDAIPAYFAEVLNFPVTQSFNLFLVLLITYSVSTCLALFFTKAKRSEAPFFMPFLIGLTLFNFFLRYDFGQREEIFVLLYMPFFILRWLRWQGRGVESKFYSCAIGIMASLGICLKPFFLIPAVLVELYFVLDKRRLSRLFTYETVSCAIVGLIYVGHFLFVPELMRKTYFEFVVPAFALGYRFWDTSLGASFSELGKRDVFYLMAVACFLAVAMRKRSTLMLPLLVFVLASVIPYLMQFKGWHYHDQPVYASAFILACMEIGFIKILIAQKLHKTVTEFGAKQTKPVKFPRRAVLACLVVVVLGIAIKDGIDDEHLVATDPRKFDMKIIGYSGTSPWSDIHSPYTDLVLDGYKLGDKAIVMSNAVSPGYPWLTQLRFVPGSRHLHMVILSVLSYVKDCLPASDKNIALYKNMDRIVGEYAEDIKANKPRFIFMQKGPDYFVEPHDFVNKHLIKDYDELQSIENFRTFRRKPGR